MAKITIQLAYGDRRIPFTLPGGNLLGVIIPKQEAGESEPADEIRILKEALAQPIGTPPLRELVKAGEVVAIVTSDLTRPCPSEKLIPAIIEELDAAGVPDEDIFIVMALGLHRPMTDEEIDQALSPEIRRRFRVLNHDPNDIVNLGSTSRGTPVEIFRPLVEADRRVCLGNLEFHYFAGYSGGAKAILPGCASRAAVTANHAMMVRPDAAAGRIEGNPLREDLEEAVAMLGADFILNAVVDAEHNILGAVAGDMIPAHRAGCQMIAERGTVKIQAKADIVVASAGGFPKDINLYQAHKALENAKYAVKGGGVLILVAECREEIGHQVFEEWMVSAASPEEIIARIQKGFVLGGHKAAAIAAIEERASIYLVSNLPDDLARDFFMNPFKTPQDALEAAFRELGGDSQVWVMPQAVSVLPKFEPQ